MHRSTFFQLHVHLARDRTTGSQSLPGSGRFVVGTLVAAVARHCLAVGTGGAKENAAMARAIPSKRTGLLGEFGEDVDYIGRGRLLRILAACRDIGNTWSSLNDMTSLYSDICQL